MSTNTDTDTELARRAFLSEIALAHRDLTEDLDLLDNWVVSVTADAMLRGADHAKLMSIRVRYLARRNTATANAVERVQNAVTEFYGDLAFLKTAA